MNESFTDRPHLPTSGEGGGGECITSTVEALKPKREQLRRLRQGSTLNPPSLRLPVSPGRDLAGGELASGARVQGGVRGASPARLDTKREIAPVDSSGGSSETSPEHREGEVSRAVGPRDYRVPRPAGEVSRPARRRQEYSHRLGRPVFRPYRPWVESVCDRVREYGAWDVASALRHCGEFAYAHDCNACGRVGRVEVRASCHSRVCPWCARIHAEKATKNIYAAAIRVPGYAYQDLAETAATVAAEEAAAIESKARWTRLATSAMERGEEDLAGRHAGRARAAEDRRRGAARARHGLATLKSWSWKLITVSPQRNKGSAYSYTPKGLLERIEAVCARVERLWERGLSYGGLAAMVVRIELSSTGHVHAHCLYFGPWIVKNWARATAGCFVDIRALQEFQKQGHEYQPLQGPRVTAEERAAHALADGVREAVKYTMKAPSVTRGGWLSGDAFRVVHPELAAAWLVATRGVQLIRYRGLMHKALKAAEAMGETVSETAPDAPTVPPIHSCVWCKSPLSPVGRLAPVAELAGTFQAGEWRKVLALIETHN